MEMLIRFASIVILARLLVPEDFGLVAMVAALTGILDSFRDLGLSAATVQRPEITHAQVSNLFWVNTGVGVVMMLAVATLSPLIADFYNDGRLVAISIALSLSFPLSGLGVQHEALMGRQLRQGEIATIRLLANLLSTGLAFALALSTMGYWALVWREVARSALITGGVWVRCRWVPGSPQRGAGTSAMIRFGGELSATGLLTGLISNVDKLLIGRFYGAAPLGMYRQAQQLLVAPIDQLNGPIMGIAQPALSALQADPPRYRRYYEKIVFLVAVLTLPMGLFVGVYADEVTLILLGPEWREAAVFVCIFGILAMMRPAIATSALVLVTCGLSTRFLLLAVAHGLVLMMFMLVGVHWSSEGVAWAHVCATAVMMLPKLYYSFLRTPATLGGFFGAVRAPFVAGLVMLGSLAALRQMWQSDDVALSALVGFVTGYTLYVFALWLQAGSRAEIKSLLADVRAALQRSKKAHAGGRL
jgi:O-antigen/teichoic acid export membrane protein